jgi:starch synthase
MYQDKELMLSARKKMMELDFSWEKSVQEYIRLYESL